MSKFIEATLVSSNGKQVEPPVIHYVSVDEIKRIALSSSTDAYCVFWLYKDEIYIAEMSAKNLKKLIENKIE